jgi:hypothetical protein
MTRFTLPLLLVALLPALVSAKRIAPTKVEPVIHEGIRYVAPNDDGRRAYIEAWDVQTNKRFWDLTIWANPIDPKVEEDIQWIFIKALGVRGDTLVVTSERGNTYRVDLTTRTIIQPDPERSPAPDETTQPHDIPEAIDRAITNGSLAKEYEVSVRVKPFYLRGDFNGDGKMDVAALVKQRSTGKLGIAIVHGKSDKVTILGAGTAIGNGADDFEWMDSWEIYSKNSASNGASVRKLHGDALLVSKSEAASALIYWNGKRYVWFQQGD